MADEITTAQAAEIIGCDRATVQRMVHDGRLPARRIGHLFVYDRSVIEWAATHKRPRRYRKRRGRDAITGQEAIAS